MTLSIGFKTDVGRKRKNNQDSYAVLRGAELNGELDALFIVADGMGGRRGGEVASRIVVQTVLETAKTFLAEREEEKDTSPIDVASLLQDMVARADIKVRQKQEQEPELDGMGTTCLMAILDANLLTVANVGDSRGYLLREGRLTQITEDHSEVWQEVKAGHMTREEAQRSRFRNVITRAIGVGPNATPDVETHRLLEGDTLLLCSDGLTSELGDPDIGRLLAGIPDPQDACDRLVEAALQHGGKDNITLIVLRYGAFTPVELPVTQWEEEEDTDPIQTWRSNPPRLSYEEDRPAKETHPEFPTEEAETQRRGRRGLSPLVWTLLVLLLLIALGEGSGLFYLWQNHKQIWPSPLPQKTDTVPQHAPKRTDKNLTYSQQPIVLYPASNSDSPLRESPLTLDNLDNIVVVSERGKVLHIDSQGKVTPLPTQTAVPSFPKTKPSPVVAIAFDASGNRYQSDPTAKVIEKYSIKNTRIDSAIGKDHLTAPTALAVDSQGNLYVIDDHRLKQFKAGETPEKPKANPMPKEGSPPVGSPKEESKKDSHSRGNP